MTELESVIENAKRLAYMVEGETQNKNLTGDCASVLCSQAAHLKGVIKVYEDRVEETEQEEKYDD